MILPLQQKAVFPCSNSNFTINRPLIYLSSASLSAIAYNTTRGETVILNTFAYMYKYINRRSVAFLEYILCPFFFG